MQRIGHDRREFIAKSFCLAGGASLAALSLRSAAAQAQTAPRPLAIALDALHVGAVAIWIGGLVGVLVVWGREP